MSNDKYRILIIGAGGFGREVLAWIQSYPEYIQLPKDNWYVGGFLDDNADALDGYDIDQEIVGKPLDFDYQASDRLVCTIADPEIKLEICQKLSSAGQHFVNVVSDPTIFQRHNSIGKGIVMVYGATMTTNVTIGDFVTLNVYSSIGHDAVIGDGCTVNGHSDITGGVILEEGVFIGTHVAATPKVKVGAFARIGAGSVVFRNVPSYTTVMGVPAKKLFRKTPDAKDDND